MMSIQGLEREKQMSNPYLIQYNTKKHSILLNFSAPIDFSNAEHVVEMLSKITNVAADSLKAQGINEIIWESIAVQDTVTKFVRTYWMN